MPENNAVNEANRMSDKAGDIANSVGKSAKQATKAGKKGVSRLSDSISSRLFNGKKKWIAVILSCLFFGLCILLVVLIAASSISSVLTVEKIKQSENGSEILTPIGTFYPRLETPVRGKKSVNQTGNNVEHYYFNSTNPFEASGRYGMPNCTAYAWSRAYEMLDSPPKLCTGNAQDWYSYNQKYEYYPYGDTPRLGAIAVWSHDNSGHVAVVEKIENGKVTFSNSAWQGSLFFTNEVDPSVYPNYWPNTSWKLLGFIYVFDEIQINYSAYGTYGTSALATIARREVEEGSHYGGQKYWSWYGFSSRVEWCACFVSYCMNKCGLLTEKPGEGHKDACAGLGWYKERGHFLPGSATPAPGMLINFGADQHHIGIVIDVRDGKVYTAEGNTYDSRTGRNDSSGFHEYPIGSPRIHGYATFNNLKSNNNINFGSNFRITSTYVPKSEQEFCQMFYRCFRQLGYSKATICGILGNIFAECSMQSYWYFAKYVPDAGGAAGNSGGICMWYGDNCSRFKRDCPNWNKSVIAQFQYLAGTLNNDGQGSYSTRYYYWCTGCKAAIQHVPNSKAGAMQAARAFMKYYERPNMGFDQSIRWIKAAEYWDTLR